MARYRRAGADLLFRDPARDHGAPFEGYYWRFTDAVRRRVVVALCGLSTHPGTRSALVGLAVHPEGVVRSAILPEARGDAGRFGVSAGNALDASPAAVRVAPTPGDGVEVTIEDARAWPRDLLGGSGVAQLIPGLPQYWHPHLIGGRVRGELTVGGERTTLDGATVYAEKNWGRDFPRRWWWGQADAFGRDDVCVAFAGGPVRVARLAIRPTLVVVRLDDRLVALAPPLAVTTAAAGRQGWRIRAHSARYRVEIEGEDSASAVALPVPVTGARMAEARAHHVLAGGLSVSVWRGRRRLFLGESALAGLERAREGDTCG